LVGLIALVGWIALVALVYFVALIVLSGAQPVALIATFVGLSLMSVWVEVRAWVVHHRHN
jgi:hypothetical protein